MAGLGGVDRILELQRERRKRSKRVDYYASDTVAVKIDRLRSDTAGGDASSILNRIVEERAASIFPELNNRKMEAQARQIGQLKRALTAAAIFCAVRAREGVSR